MSKVSGVPNRVNRVRWSQTQPIATAVVAVAGILVFLAVAILSLQRIGFDRLIAGFVLCAAIAIIFLTPVPRRYTLAVVMPVALPLGTRPVAGTSTIDVMTAGTALSILALAIFAAVRPTFKDSKPELKSPIVVPAAIALLALIFAGYIFRGFSWESLAWIAGIFLLIAAMCASEQALPSPDELRRGLLVAFLTSVALDIYLAYSGRNFQDEVGVVGRFRGALQDYELTAEYYAVAWALALGSFVIDRRPIWRAAAIAVLVGSGYVQLATGTRGGLILVVASTLLLSTHFLLRVGESRARWRTVLATAVLVAGAFGTWSIISNSIAWQRFTQFNYDGGASESLNRAQVWRDFTGKPSFIRSGLFGNGLPFEYETLATFPHNLVLWSMWTWGIFGAALLLLVVAGVLFRGLRGLWVRNQHAVVAAVCLVVVSLDQVKIEVARRPASIALLFAMMVYVIVSDRSIRSDDEASL